MRTQPRMVNDLWSTSSSGRIVGSGLRAPYWKMMPPGAVAAASFCKVGPPIPLLGPVAPLQRGEKRRIEKRVFPCVECLYWHRRCLNSWFAK